MGEVSKSKRRASAALWVANNAARVAAAKAHHSPLSTVLQHALALAQRARGCTRERAVCACGVRSLRGEKSSMERLWRTHHSWHRRAVLCNGHMPTHITLIVGSGGVTRARTHTHTHRSLNNAFSLTHRHTVTTLVSSGVCASKLQPSQMTTARTCLRRVIVAPTPLMTTSTPTAASMVTVHSAHLPTCTLMLTEALGNIHPLLAFPPHA